MSPFGTHEYGDGVLMSSVPAIINAIYDAEGVTLKRIPAPLDMILEAKKTRHKKQKMSLLHFE